MQQSMDDAHTKNVDKAVQKIMKFIFHELSGGDVCPSCLFEDLVKQALMNKISYEAPDPDIMTAMDKTKLAALVVSTGAAIVGELAATISDGRVETEDHSELPKRLI